MVSNPALEGRRPCQGAGVKPPQTAAGQNYWYSHVHARLLDRIDFEATNQVVATQSPESIVVASRTDPAFAKVPALANSWKPLSQRRTPRNRASRPNPTKAA